MPFNHRHQINLAHHVPIQPFRIKRFTRNFGDVEVPARVDAGGIHPLKVGPVPEAFAAMMRTQFTIHAILTEAWRTRSRRLLLQALLLDPCVTGIGAAERMLDDMLVLQAEYLPKFE